MEKLIQLEFDFFPLHNQILRWEENKGKIYDTWYLIDKQLGITQARIEVYKNGNISEFKVYSLYQKVIIELNKKLRELSNYE